MKPSQNPMSEIINVHRYDDSHWIRIHSGLESYSFDKHVFRHITGHVYRKGWEWTQALWGLEKLGMLRPDYTALGVGAGREPVIFYLADKIAKVIATDLYGNDAWSKNQGAEAPADILLDAAKYCPRAFNYRSVKFENADGTNLQYDSDSFDFCWSLSSIEHFGGHEAAKKAVQEMARVTRTGGIVCIATEFLLLDEHQHSEYFTKKDIENYIIKATPSLTLVDGMNWDLPPTEYLIDQICVLTDGVHRRRRHVILSDGNYQWTSIILFFKKEAV